MDSIDATVYSAAVHEKVAAFRRLLSQYEPKITDKTAAHLIQAIKLLVYAVEEVHIDWVLYVRSAFAAKPDQRDDHIKTNSKILLILLRNIHRDYFPLLDAAARQTPFLITPVLQRAVSFFAGTQRIALMLVPQFNYMYSFSGMRKFPTRQIQSLGYIDQTKQDKRLQEAASIAEVIGLIAFPAVESELALTWGVVIHEMGHLVDFVQGIYSQILPLKLDQQSFEKLVEDALQAALPPNTTDPITKLQYRPEVEARCYKACNRMLESWLQEIIADVLAIHALGPAFLFSFVEFLAHFGADNQPDPGHPAPARRLAMVMKELEELGYLTVDNALLGSLVASKASIDGESAKTTYTGAAQVVDLTISHNLGHILSGIKAAVAPYSFKVEQFNEQVGDLVDRLARGIAPIERFEKKVAEFKLASAIAVLNAGWTLKKTRAQEFLDLFDSVIPVEHRWLELNRLLLKAIECGEIVRLKRAKA